MFVARNSPRRPSESRRDGMFRDGHAAPTELEEGLSGMLCYKHAVPTELLRNFSIYSL